MHQRLRSQREAQVLRRMGFCLETTDSGDGCTILNRVNTTDLNSVKNVNGALRGVS